jgi:hypothetical protein
VVVLGFVAACGGGERPADAILPVTPNASREATAPIVDEQEGFTLASPGAGWKLLGAEAAQLVPDARAGAMSDTVTAVVAVERVPPISLERYADRVALALALEDAKISRRQAERVGDNDAWRLVASGRRGGVELRIGVLVTTRAERAYRVVAWADAGAVSEDGAAFSPLFQALSLRDAKKASAHPRTESSADGQGVDWRLEGRHFESAAAELDVKTPEGWQPIAGDALERVAPGADLALARPELGMHVVLESEPCAGKPEELALELETAFASALGGKTDSGRVNVELLGSPVALGIHRADEREYAHGVQVSAGRCLQLLAHYPIAERERARRVLPSALAAVRSLPAARATALVQELALGKKRLVGADYVIHERVLRHFGRGIVWRLPRGPWRLAVGEAAMKINRDALAVVQNRNLGIEALLIAEDAVGLDAAEYHQRTLKGMTARVRFHEAHRDKGQLASAAAIVSDGVASLRGLSLACRLLTRVRTGDPALQVLVWGRSENMQAHAEQVGRLLAGIELDTALRAQERTTDAFRDWRLGYEVKLPSVWKQEDRTPASLAPSGSYVRWEREGRWVGLMAFAGEPLESKFAAGVLEQLLREDLGAFARGDEEREPATVAGWPAQRISWHALFERVDALVFERDGIAYALVSVDSSGEALSRARDSFAFRQFEAAP